MTEGLLTQIWRERTGLEVSPGALSAIVAAARAAWPKIAMTDEAFVEHLARHARDETPLEKRHVTDLYLACGVSLHDPAALSYFEEHFIGRVPDYVLRIRMSLDAIDEVQQKLREDLVMGREGRSPKITEYSGKGALGGWLRITAVRTALNHLRASGPPEDRLREDGDEMALANDPELAYVKEHAQDLFSDAFKRVLAGLDANERSILRLHYIEGLTMDQLSRLYKTPRSTIARRVADARQQVLSATEALLRDERRLSPSAVASVIRQAQSQLEVTLTRLLD